MSKKKISTKKKAIHQNYIKLGDEIWPLESNIFSRPARMKYVRKLIKPKECVFCTASKSKESLKTLCVYKSYHSQIVINKFPYNGGHILVMPIRHCGDLLSLNADEYTDLMATLKLATQAMTALYNPQGYNIGLNNGATAGAGIPEHLHFHIVPRWNGDLNFFPLIADTKLVIEDATVSYKKYFKYFSELKNKLNKANKLLKKGR